MYSRQIFQGLSAFYQQQQQSHSRGQLHACGRVVGRRGLPVARCGRRGIGYHRGGRGGDRRCLLGRRLRLIGALASHRGGAVGGRRLELLCGRLVRVRRVSGGHHVALVAAVCYTRGKKTGKGNEGYVMSSGNDTNNKTNQKKKNKKPHHTDQSIKRIAHQLRRGSHCLPSIPHRRACRSVPVRSGN